LGVLSADGADVLHVFEVAFTFAFAVTVGFADTLTVTFHFALFAGTFAVAFTLARDVNVLIGGVGHAVFFR